MLRNSTFKMCPFIRMHTISICFLPFPDESFLHASRSTLHAPRCTLPFAQTSDFGLQTLGFSPWTLDLGPWTLDFDRLRFPELAELARAEPNRLFHRARPPR